jgi:hypothetical protein
LPSARPSDLDVDRVKIDRARLNAEELFKPKSQPSSAEAAGASVQPAQDQPQRQPRIFRMPPVVPMRAEKGEAPTRPRPTRRQRQSKRYTGTIPASQFGRVRALASYGMTQLQVAELYGVGVDEIERIVAQSNSPTA